MIEVDGKMHDYQRKKDELRSLIINDLGMKVMRFSNKEIEENLRSVLGELKKHL